MTGRAGVALRSSEPPRLAKPEMRPTTASVCEVSKVPPVGSPRLEKSSPVRVISRLIAGVPSARSETVDSSVIVARLPGLCYRGSHPERCCEPPGRRAFCLGTSGAESPLLRVWPSSSSQPPLVYAVRGKTKERQDRTLTLSPYVDFTKTPPEPFLIVPFVEMRWSSKGRASVFQTDDVGSTPTQCSTNYQVPFGGWCPRTKLASRSDFSGGI